MAFITMPQALQLIGQAPVQHGNATAVEGLRVAKSLFPMFGGGGQMGNLLQTLMQNGPGALLQNPMGALSGVVNGQLGGIVSQLQGLTDSNFNMSGLISAISGGSGLQGALGQLTDVANTLVGLPGGGQFGLQDIMGHLGLQQLGIQIPAVASMQNVLGPILSNTHLDNIASTLVPMAQQVVNGGDPSGMLAQVQGFTAQTLGIINASNAALNFGQATTMQSAALAVVTDAIRQAPTGIVGDLLNQIVNTDARAQIEEHLAETQAMFDALAADIPDTVLSI